MKDNNPDVLPKGNKSKRPPNKTKRFNPFTGNQNVAHLIGVGPTGAGKSAMSNALVLELINQTPQHHE